MSATGDQDPLKPALEKAQAELAKHLDEACETDADDLGSVDELLRLEEELLAAARAADEAVRLRRRLEKRQVGDADRPPAASGGTVTPPPPEAGGRVREFRDGQGRAWRVWEVRPGLDRPLSQLQRYLGDYVNGWLAFNCLDNDIRKRLPGYPPDWLAMSDRELEGLLERALEVTRREKVKATRDTDADGG
jgi:hypothetical protein